jgi:hypothetical protein
MYFLLETIKWKEILYIFIPCFFNDASSCDICCFHNGAAEDKVHVRSGTVSLGVMASYLKWPHKSTPSTAKKEQQDDLWKTNRKVFGRNQSLAKVRHSSRIFRQRGEEGGFLWESKETAFRVAGLRAQAWNRDPPTKKQKRYWLDNDAW